MDNLTHAFQRGYIRAQLARKYEKEGVKIKVDYLYKTKDRNEAYKRGFNQRYFLHDEKVGINALGKNISNKTVDE